MIRSGVQAGSQTMVTFVCFLDAVETVYSTPPTITSCMGQFGVVRVMVTSTASGWTATP